MIESKDVTFIEPFDTIGGLAAECIALDLDEDENVFLDDLTISHTNAKKEHRQLMNHKKNGNINTEHLVGVERSTAEAENNQTEKN